MQILKETENYDKNRVSKRLKMLSFDDMLLCAVVQCDCETYLICCRIYRLGQQTSARDTIGVGYHGCVLIVGNYHS